MVLPKPDSFRAKVWRRLQRLGAVAIKTSVYVLPRTPETVEDFEWQMREIGADAQRLLKALQAAVTAVSSATHERPPKRRRAALKPQRPRPR